MIRVLVAAVSPLQRAGLREVIRGSDGIELAGDVSSWDGLEESARAVAPDVVLAFLVPEIDELPPGLQTLMAQGPPPGIVLLADPILFPVRNVLRDGAVGVLALDARPEAIRVAVTAAAEGLVTLSSQALASALEPAASGFAERGEPLVTTRELEVLRFLADGAANKEIAWRLGISEHTVKFHVASILEKLGAGSRAEAVAVGMRRGLIPL